MTLTTKGIALAKLGRYEQAEQILSEALAAAAERGSLGYQAELLLALGSMTAEQKKFDQATQLLNRAMDFAIEVGGNRLVAEISIELSAVQLAQGQAEQAMKGLLKGIAAARASNERFLLPRLLAHGGYNWTALAAGFVFLFAVNVAATQFVAARFHYQAALGAPLIVYRSTGVYQPFAWAGWLMRYGGDPDPRVRMPILLGALIVVFASAVTVGMAYALNLRRTRKLPEGMEDLHGSARWATATEIEATGLLTSTHLSITHKSGGSHRNSGSNWQDGV